MGAYSKTKVRGLLIPDHRFSSQWTDETNATEASPRAGVPVAGTDTEAVLKASGHTTDNTKTATIDVQATRGGYAGKNDAAFAWKYGTDAATGYRGWDVPSNLSMWRNVQYSNTALRNQAMHVVNVVKPDGSEYMLQFHTAKIASLSPSAPDKTHVYFRKRTIDADWTAATSIYQQDTYVNGNSATLLSNPCGVVLPSGRVQVFFLFYNSLQGSMSVQMYYTDDEGDNWLQGSGFCISGLDVSATTSAPYVGIPKRLRVAYSNGQHLLLLHLVDSTLTKHDVIKQYASDDMGVSFSEVTTDFTGAAAGNAGGWPDIVGTGGKFVVSFISNGVVVPSGRLAVQVLANAFSPLDPGTAIISDAAGTAVNTVILADLTSTAVLASGENALVQDEDGVLYCYVVYNPSVTPRGKIFQSVDGGINWDYMSYLQDDTDGGSWFNPRFGNFSTVGIRPTDYAVCAHRGQIVMVHNILDAASVGPASYTQDFESTSVGSIPTGWSTSGDANWEVQSGDSYDGTAKACVSGNIGNNDSTTLEYSTTLAVDSVVTFYWKCSTEATFDVLRFFVDGVQQAVISGTVGWTLVTENVSAGARTFRWTYSKDVSVSSGTDEGKIDQFEIRDGTVADDTSFMVSKYGGYTTTTLPALTIYDRASERLSWQFNYIGAWLPTSMGFTTSGVGTQAIDTTEGALKLTVPSTLTRTYTAQWAVGTGAQQIAFTEGYIGRITTKRINNGKKFRIVNTVSDGATNTVELRIEWNDTGIEVYEHSGSTLLGSLAISAAKKPKAQIFWALRGTESGGASADGEVTVWARTYDDEIDASADREWTSIYSGAITLNAAGAAISSIVWGNPVTADECEQYIYDMCLSEGARPPVGSDPRIPMNGIQLAQGQSNPGGLYGRNFSGLPLYIAAKTRISLTDGPTFRNDSWSIPLRHIYEIENVLPVNSPSPQQGWRSANNVNDTAIAFQLNADGEDEYNGAPLYGVYLENCNFKQVVVTRYRGGSWVAAGTMNMFREIQFERKGGSVVATTGGSAPSFSSWVGYDELKGCTIEFFDGGSTYTTAKIKGNSAGFTYQPEGKLATIFLDPDTYTEASLPASGVAYIWHKNGLLLFEKVNNDIEAIKLNMSPSGVSSLPYEGYHTIGTMVAGHACIFGMDYSRERIVNKEARTELTTYRNGARHAYIAGEPRKTVRFAWSEGVDVTDVRREYEVGASAEPTWVEYATGGEPVANRYSAPLTVQSLVNRLDGSAIPVVYMPNIDTVGSLGDQTIYAAAGCIYGRMTSPITLETGVGEEETSEVYRVNTVTIEQEL